MTIVGKCIGAGRKDEAIYYIKKLSKMAEAAIIISCLVVFALCRPDYHTRWNGSRKCKNVFLR